MIWSSLSELGWSTSGGGAEAPAFCNPPKGYDGVENIFLLLAMMAVARLTAIEQLRYIAPGE